MPAWVPSRLQALQLSVKDRQLRHRQLYHYVSQTNTASMWAKSFVSSLRTASGGTLRVRTHPGPPQRCLSQAPPRCHAATLPRAHPSLTHAQRCCQPPSPQPGYLRPPNFAAYYRRSSRRLIVLSCDGLIARTAPIAQVRPPATALACGGNTRSCVLVIQRTPCCVARSLALGTARVLSPSCPPHLRACCAPGRDSGQAHANHRAAPGVRHSQRAGDRQVSRWQPTRPSCAHHLAPPLLSRAHARSLARC